jgi:hypothetical protein
LGEPIFGTSTLRDIESGSNQPDRLAGDIVYGPPLGMDDADDSVRTDDTIMSIIYGA